MAQRNCFFARKDNMKEAKNVTAKNNNRDWEGVQGLFQKKEIMTGVRMKLEKSKKSIILSEQFIEIKLANNLKMAHTYNAYELLINKINIITDCCIGIINIYLNLSRFV